MSSSLYIKARVVAYYNTDSPALNPLNLLQVGYCLGRYSEDSPMTFEEFYKTYKVMPLKDKICVAIAAVVNNPDKYQEYVQQFNKTLGASPYELMKTEKGQRRLLKYLENKTGWNK
jgi:hypothetical protein